jgi:SAM-dependent methyltransferase
LRSGGASADGGARGVLLASAEDVRALANSPRRDAGSTRRVYSYPAKFQAHLPAELIRRFSRPGELVVDPWCGGGTTLLEAWLAGRASVGVDLSPFACLVARVKTTRVAERDALSGLEAACASRAGRDAAVLDGDDRQCLGARVADEIERLAAGLDRVPAGAVRDLLTVSLIHAVKLAGRRDFDDESIVPLFRRKAEASLRAVLSLPEDGPRPRVEHGSNHEIPSVATGAAALVVTSPPYKDLDVEYGLLQIQRPTLGRSKRSQVIWRLLGREAVPKKTLCGGAGEAYWPTLDRSLAEIVRLLAPRAAAFFWTGFKTEDDQRRFEERLAAAGLDLVLTIPAVLSRDRVASSRSTHHGRPTGMLSRDVLFATVRREAGQA